MSGARAAGPVLSLVVPVYDEREVLPLFVARARPVLDGLGVAYEVVAVDDGSTDGSRELLQELAAAWPELRPVRLRRNRRGGAPAVVLGAVLPVLLPVPPALPPVPPVGSAGGTGSRVSIGVTDAAWRPGPSARIRVCP